ncbi:MAG TPA: ABC transporter substrate-binding protein [Puia sp.]|jgi:branched-chain amino acid transport system substrate-binding protein|nr:ABC transporter substrate-binding protein [Puia sp.]
MNKLILCLLFTFVLVPSRQSKGNDPGTVKIAAIFATSGDARDDNSSAVAGVKYAAAYYNKHGGINGRRIDLIVFDNKSTLEGSRQAAEEAVKAHVLAIIGCGWSSHSMEVAAVAQRNRLPMITNVASSPAVTQVGNYIFRVCFTDPYQGKFMALFAWNDIKAKTAVIFQQNTGEYSPGLAKQFTATFENAGGKVLKLIPYTIESPDFTEYLKEVKRLAPDVIFFPGHYETGRIMKQARLMGIQSVFLGADGWGTPGFFQEGGSYIDNAYYDSHWDLADTSRASRDFVKDFGNNEYTIAPAALAFDAVGVLVKACSTVSDLGDPEALRKAIAATANYPGVTGTITLNENRDPIDKKAVIIKIEHGQQRFYK